MTMMRRLAASVLVGAVWASACLAAPIGPLPASERIIRVDAQDPVQLPPRLRNHCGFDRLRGRYYCADHCGIGYQLYYCSEESFGCCHLGRGYCGWDGILHCSP
jgi:hypothetical protein